MPSIHASDIGDGSGQGKIWAFALGGLLICGVGFGVYHFAGPAITVADKPIAMAMPTAMTQQLHEREQKLKERQEQSEEQFRASLGLSNAQIAQLARLETETSNPRTKYEGIKGMMNEEQWTKYQQHNPQMRWGGGFGGPGGGGPGQGQGGRGRRRGGDGGTSGTQQAPPV